MGTDWGIGCRDCAPPLNDGFHLSRDADDDGSTKRWFTGEWDNCRDLAALAKICEATEEIIALHERIGDLLIVTWSGYVGSFGGSCDGLVEFLCAHRGHRLAPMCEYLEFDGDSGRCSTEGCVIAGRPRAVGGFACAKHREVK